MWKQDRVRWLLAENKPQKVLISQYRWSLPPSFYLLSCTGKERVLSPRRGKRPPCCLLSRYVLWTFFWKCLLESYWSSEPSFPHILEKIWTSMLYEWSSPHDIQFPIFHHDEYITQYLHSFILFYAQSWTTRGPIPILISCQNALQDIVSG